MNFSLSLRTGTLISIGPGPHPRERGGGKHFRAITEEEKKKKKTGKRAGAGEELRRPSRKC